MSKVRNYVETKHPQQWTVNIGFSPLYWRFGVRSDVFSEWAGGEGKGMYIAGWRATTMQFGPFSVRFGALPIIPFQAVKAK